MKEPTTGELNRRVTIRRRSDLPAPDMSTETVFDAQIQRWAKIEPVGSVVYAGSVQIDAAVTHRVIVRFWDGLTDHHEVVHGDRIYRVKRITDMNGGRRFTALEVEELVHGQ